MEKNYALHLTHPVFKVISKELQSSNEKAFVIGGFVRDLILGNTSKDIDIVFILNVFKTKTHPKRDGLGVKKLFELCIFLKNKLNFALGGVNRTNIKRLKNKDLKGFGAISCFRK